MTALARPTAIAIRPKLTAIERSQLIRSERIIENYLKCRQEAAIEITRIHDQQLYKEDYDSFEDYVRSRWDKSISQVYRDIRHVEHLRVIETTGLPLPTTEYATRPLDKLAPEVQMAAYTEAVEASGGKAPSGPKLAEAVAKVKKRGKDEHGAPRGIIPIGATVIVTEPDPVDEMPAPEPVRELTDAEWLESLPIRANFTGYVRDRFDADALFWRFLDPLRKRIQLDAKLASREAKHNGHQGPYLNTYLRFVSTDGPDRWIPCEDCKGTSRHNLGLTGECPTCRGAGYHVR